VLGIATRLTLGLSGKRKLDGGNGQAVGHGNGRVLTVTESVEDKCLKAACRCRPLGNMSMYWVNVAILGQAHQENVPIRLGSYFSIQT
jgi:hypothetical protein